MSHLTPGTERVREILATRLVTRHGLTPLTAYLAVVRVQHGIDGRHRQLVLDEARLTAQETAVRLNQTCIELARTLLPAMHAMGDAARQAARALQQNGLIDDHGHPTRPQDRPAWQSPYGPARHR